MVPPLALAHLSNALIYAVQAVAFGYLYRRRRDSPVGLWLAASALLLAFSVASTVAALLPTAPSTEVPWLVLLLFACTSLSDGALRFAARRLPLFVWVAAALAGVWAAAAAGIGSSVVVASLPAAVLIPLVLASSGVRLWRSERGRSVGGRTASVGLCLWAAHFANYPLLREVIWFAPLGFVIAGVLDLVIVLGLVVLHFEVTGARARSLEAELAQARKLEALGRVAGGIAHDFNNLLTVVMSGAQMLSAAQLTDRDRALLANVNDAAERAAELVKQLLSFSRKQPRPTTVIDVVASLRKTESVICALVGEQIEVVLIAPELPLAVRIDESRLNQVVLNLAANARDAMPEGGTLTVRLALVDGGSAEVAEMASTAAQVLIEISDTGAGMSAEVIDKAFEPFFSTKDHASGTGLGLAIVHGIVSQCDGQVFVESVVGEGTTVRLLLPARDPSSVEQEPPIPEAGAGLVLLVEDEPLLRAAARHMLEESGYEVLLAADGIEAFEIYQRHADRVDAVVTDILMPRRDGIELARLLLDRAPQLPILITSAHGDRADSVDALGGKAVRFLPKPYTPDTLRAALTRVRSAPR